MLPMGKRCPKCNGLQLVGAHKTGCPLAVKKEAMNVHTIWVPSGWSVEQTWETVKRGEKVKLHPKGLGAWVNVG